MFHSGALRQDLASAALSVETTELGIVARGEKFTGVLEALSSTIARRFGQGVEALRFPPVMPRSDLERIGYFRNFPQLLGVVHCACGQDHLDAVSKADPSFGDSGLVLTPAACYPLYAILAARGVVPCDGVTVQLRSYCFRREPSEDPARLQSFQMQEFVRIGSADQVSEFRQAWIDRGGAFFSELGLAGEVAIANDPFFGRAASVMVRDQRRHALKYELSVVLSAGAPPTACMSFNHHRDHFTQAFELRSAQGEVESACVGFGLERTTLALFATHGLDHDQWPRDILRLLGLG